MKLRKFLKKYHAYKHFIENFDEKLAGVPLSLYFIDFATHPNALQCAFDWHCAHPNYYFWAHLEQCWLNNVYNRLGC